MGKVFVVLSKKNTSGGGESLHQLVDNLRSYGADAYIYYFDKYKCAKSEQFETYDVPIAERIEDNENNLIIVPEVYSGFLSKIKYAKRYIWWLSADFYYQSSPKNVAEHFLKKNKLPLFLSRMVMIHAWLSNRYSMIPRFSFNKINFGIEKDIYHYYNCEYARQMLVSLGVSSNNMSYMCGPLSKEHITDYESKFVKENIIAYNPKKGMEYTEKIIEYSEINGYDLVFKRIENMPSIEVKKLLMKSKVYIDFGFFPGPERIPREAVLENCVVITSKDGAAGNQIDVPIPNKYKFNKEKSNLEDIVLFIKSCISNYPDIICDFDNYREKVKNQINLFDEEAKKIAGISKGYEQ